VVATEVSTQLAGEFAGPVSLRRRHREHEARARQLHDARPGMAALLDRVDAFDVYVVAEAVTARWPGPTPCTRQRALRCRRRRFPGPKAAGWKGLEA